MAYAIFKKNDEKIVIDVSGMGTAYDELVLRKILKTLCPEIKSWLLLDTNILDWDAPSPEGRIGAKAEGQKPQDLQDGAVGDVRKG